MHLPALRERRDYRHTPLLGGVDVLAAEYREHHFPRHAQSQVVLGMVEAGAIEFRSGGRSASLTEGDLLFIAPETVHEAFGHGDGAWTYRALYLSADQWRLATQGRGDALQQGARILHAPMLAARIGAIHRALVSGLGAERALMRALSDVDRALGDADAADPHGAGDAVISEALARVRGRLDADPTRRISLDEMAQLAGLSRFHFLRAFTDAFGVSPYAYSVNVRIAEAQRRLALGEPISATAFTVGFADQAHLTRAFLRTVGVTPGEYRRAFAQRTA